MSKIIKAINAMVSNKDKITKVSQGTNKDEIFFVYDGKHKWSEMKSTQNEDSYVLFYYTSNYTIEQLASIEIEGWEHLSAHYVTYRSSEIGTTEAQESFSELYTIINEKVHGMDDILEEIIATDLVPF